MLKHTILSRVYNPHFFINSRVSTTSLFVSVNNLSKQTMSTAVSATVPSSSTSTTTTTSSSSTTTTTLSHHAGNGRYQNPLEWNSYVDNGLLDFFTKALPEWRKVKLYPLPIKAVNWEEINNAPSTLVNTNTSIQSLWIGHVTFLLQSIQGLNILTDPVFSDYASPVNYIGPPRYTPSPCKIDELPPIHIVLISHNHYDHVDSASIRNLVQKEKKDLKMYNQQASHSEKIPYTGTHYYCPLGVGALLQSFGVNPDKITELDWWQERQYTVPPTNTASITTSNLATLSCVPAQHQSARTPFDRNTTLWCGWVITFHNGSGITKESSKVYFSGDTGYRSVAKGTLPYSEEENNAVRCPIFKQIGERYGPIDLGLLPIGAYSPRTFMSSVHASPEDAVEMHAELVCKKSIGMHWGTFNLTDEPIEEPPQRLEEAVRRKGLEKDAFVAIKQGEIVRV